MLLIGSLTAELNCGFNCLQEFELDVRKGDVVVMATDGVLDNVFPREAEAIVSLIHRRGEPPSVAAEGLAQFAQSR